MRLHSMWLSDGRRLTVYMPDRLPFRSRRRLPLLILHDGQNLFEPERAFCGQHWRVGETADRLIAARRIPPLLICGLDHGGERRIRELTPTPGSRRDGGAGPAHARFVVRDVLPLLRREFPVTHLQARTALGGSSLGGLATMFTALMYPHVFGGLLMMSPSIWWDRRVILRLLDRRARAMAGTRIWLDIGAGEGSRAVADARVLAVGLGRLAANIRTRPLEFRFVEDPLGQHSEVSWASRLPAALEFLFGGRGVTS